MKMKIKDKIDAVGSSDSDGDLRYQLQEASQIEEPQEVSSKNFTRQILINYKQHLRRSNWKYLSSHPLGHFNLVVGVQTRAWVRNLMVFSAFLSQK